MSEFWISRVKQGWPIFVNMRKDEIKDGFCKFQDYMQDSDKVLNMSE